MFVATQLAGLNRRFGFEAVKFPKDAFFVVQFEGEEALSALYRFELLLASKNSDIDASALIGTAAHFSLSDGVVDGQPAIYQSLIQEFSYEYETGGWTFYRAILVPELWKLETFVLSEVYLDKSRPEIFNTVLENARMRSNAYEMRLSSYSANAPKLEYICQYRESYLTFISRWAERLGVYWWYENTGGQEKAVFTDLRTAHKDEAMTLHYQPTGELDAQSTQKRRCRRLRQVTQNQPKQVVIRDFSAHRASQELKGTAQVNPERGIGELHFFGRKLKSVMDIEQRAKIAAESLRCRAVRYFGSSTATGLRCGHFVRLADHPRNSFNRRYLLTEVKHRGSQAGLLLDGLGIDAKQKISDFYLADFTAIPDDVQFRPEERHPWPRIIGTINAFIDAEGSGQYAELNQYGEYKVQVPFAMTKKSAYRGSAWIRMATPYAGSDHGMHFPLLKGTEVLLSFVNGDPDQPVIMGAVPNSITPNVVTNVNQKQSRIRTAGGNEITLHDEEGMQHMLFKTPSGNTTLCLGSVGFDPSTAKYSYTSKARSGMPQQWQAPPPKAKWQGVQQMWQGGEMPTNLARQQQQQTTPEQDGTYNFTGPSADGVTMTTDGAINITSDVSSNAAAPEPNSTGITLTANDGDITLNANNQTAGNGNIVFNAQGNFIQNIKGSSWFQSEGPTGKLVNGFSTSTYLGAANSNYIGLSNSNYIGLSANSYFASANAYFLSTNIYSISSNTYLAAFNNYGFYVNKYGFRYDTAIVRIDKAGVRVDNTAAKIDMKDFKLEELGVHVNNGAATLRSANINLFTSQADVRSAIATVRKENVSVDDGNIKVLRNILITV